jgi:hypothetical protein
MAGINDFNKTWYPLLDTFRTKKILFEVDSKGIQATLALLNIK